MMKEQQQSKEEVKKEVQEHEKVDPLVKKEIVKVKVEISIFFHFTIFYYIILFLLTTLVYFKICIVFCDIVYI